jgi:hypothetical protein
VLNKLCGSERGTKSVLWCGADSNFTCGALSMAYNDTRLSLNDIEFIYIPEGSVTIVPEKNSFRFQACFIASCHRIASKHRDYHINYVNRKPSEY